MALLLCVREDRFLRRRRRRHRRRRRRRRRRPVLICRGGIGCAAGRRVVSILSIDFCFSARRRLDDRNSIGAPSAAAAADDDDLMAGFVEGERE